MKNDCNAKLYSCKAGCGSDAGCEAACKTSYNDCATPYRNECLTCAENEHSCDPSADCYVIVM